MKKTIQSIILAAGLASGLSSALQAQPTTSWTIGSTNPVLAPGYTGGYAGSITNWTAPNTGYYSIRAYGGSTGGAGAVIGGVFYLTSNTTLNILVGSGNIGYTAAGAGGTFVVTSSTNPLVVAGGGGGSGQKNYTDWNSANASLTTSGNDAYYFGANQQGSGGTNGYGGTIGSDSSARGSGGGGGFYGNGGTHLITAAINHGDIAAQGGFSYVNGGYGGYDNPQTSGPYTENGYFGGGGQTGANLSPPGGGGGGYSGGGGGGVATHGNNYGSGGGGGSYLDASALHAVKYVNNSSIPNFTANGMVWIYEVTSATLTNGTTAEANVEIGTGGISNESLFVANPGTLLTSSNNVVVGDSTTGNSMVISGGGQVQNFVSGIIGSQAGASSNSVTVNGSGSRWRSDSNMIVGENGSGNSLVVSSGGAVLTGIVSNSTVVGYNAGSSSNSVLVTGSGSTFTNNGVTVGYSGSGNSLVIANGGFMQGIDSDTVIGYNSTSAGNSLQVTGAGSTLVGGKIEVGSGGSGNSLLISSGGYVTSNSGEIGANAGSSSNNVLVTGSGSTWEATFGVQVGSSGAGVLTVADGGLMLVDPTEDSSFTIGKYAGSSGTLNIGRYGTNEEAGTVSTPKIAFGAGTGTINFNQSNSTTVSAAISGNGSVNQLGTGTTILSASNSYTGATTVGGGLLVVNGSIASSAVTVNSGGTLAGSGSVGGLIVNSGGTINPGNSPGTVNINGDIDWLGGGNYNWQIAGLTGTAGTVSTWDLVSATGILDLTALTTGSQFNINLWSLSSTGPDVSGALSGFDNTQGYTWKIATAAGGIAGFSADKFLINNGVFNGTGGFANALNGGSFSLAQSGNDLNLVFTAATGPAAVPEPGTWAAAALLAGGAAFMRWRKRAKVA